MFLYAYKGYLSVNAFTFAFTASLFPSGSAAINAMHSAITSISASLSPLVVTAGVPVGESGTTNLIKVHVISEEISTGMGVGRETVEGKVKIVKNGETCIDFNEGDILITSILQKILKVCMYPKEF